MLMAIKTSIEGKTTDQPQDRAVLGARLKHLRKTHGWTLADVASRTGLAVSTVSKVERGRMTLAYDKFSRLATGLGLDIGELFSDQSTAFQSGSVAVAGEGRPQPYETENYVYDMLFPELTNKKMTPMMGWLKADDVVAFSTFVSHPGEEFLMVLEGEVVVHFEGRDAVVLKPFESIYFDSERGHLYVSSGPIPARILVVCTNLRTTSEEQHS